MNTEPDQSYQRFKDFYPYYLSEHQNINCRRLHFIGSLLVLTVLLSTFISSNLWLLFALPITGYGFAWVGHFCFEKNKPATFKYPLYSLIGDWMMLIDILRGRIKI